MKAGLPAAPSRSGRSTQSLWWAFHSSTTFPSLIADAMRAASASSLASMVSARMGAPLDMK